MQNIDKQDPGFGLDIQVFMDVIALGDSARRISLGNQIAAFIANPETPSGERAQVQPVAMRLAADPDIAVRQAFAAALAPVKDLAADLFFAIVADEEEVSLPFLAEAAALDATRALAVLRAGDAARQAIVVSRSDLAREALDAVTRELPAAINVLLLENADIGLTAAHYHALYQRFGEDRDILHLLLSRADLPAVIRLIQARRAAANLSGLLARRDWMPGRPARELVMDAEENATLGVLVQTPADELPAAVAFLVDNEYLTASLVVHAACRGAMDIVAQALATLAGMPLRRAEELMYGRGRFRSLFARCGLPESCFWTLRAACDTARDERLDALQFTADQFGRRLIENLLTRYADIPAAEQPRHLEFLSRFASAETRSLAARLKADLQRAA